MVDAPNTASEPAGNTANAQRTTAAASGAEQNPGRASAESRRIAPRSPRAALEPERMPEPSRHLKRVRHPVVVAGNAIITIIIVVAVALGTALAVGKQRFEAPGPLEQEKIVNIPPRLGVRDIADLLKREGVIEQPWLFIGSVLALKAREDLKYGEYAFPKQASRRDVVDTLVEGKVLQHQITFAEGLTSEQIVARLLQNDVLSGTLKDIPKEGALLPETYSFNRGTTRERIIQLMQQSQRRILQDVWERRIPDLPIRTPEQLVVLASLIEKETGKPEERPRVAAVFINRLKQKMKLQSDPTIIYGLVGGKGTLGRPIMKSEIEQATPYNTYVIDGLPPGPIANPGRASLEAAANPSRTKELFFVSDGAGGHLFAETLDQHLRNVARLRLIEQQRDQNKTLLDQPTGQAPAAFVPPSAPASPVVVPQPAPKGARAAQPSQPGNNSRPR